MSKLLTTLAAGCPVVTTPEGVWGIPELVDGVHLVIRPLGESFVDAVAAVLADPLGVRGSGPGGRPPDPRVLLGRRARRPGGRAAGSTAAAPTD